MLSTAPALAHATLLGTDPPDRTALATSPDSIALRFNEPMQTVFVRLLDQAGRVIAEAPPGGSADWVTVRPAAPLAPGQYLVSYRVLSEDAHPIAGTLVFAVGAAPQEWAAPPEVAADVHTAFWQRLAAANRALHFLALSLVAGATLFLILLRADPQPARAALLPTARTSIALGLATAAVAVVLQGGITLDAAPSRPLSIDLWNAGMATSQGHQSIAAFLLLLALWRMGWSNRTFALGAAAILAVGLLATLALTGHVVTAAGRAITVPILLAHSVPAMLWIGSFAPLLVVANGGDTPTIRRWARLASGGLVLLVAGAVGIAILQVRGPDGLFGTAYGWTLLLKNALAVLLLGMAAINRWRLTPLLAAGDPRPLAGSIRRELVLGALVLAVTASLAQTPPPRSLLAEGGAADPLAHEQHTTEEAYSVAIVAQGKTAILSVAPARVGRNTITVALRGQGWTDLAPLEVTASFQQAAAGIEPIARTMQSIGPGLYEYAGPEMTIPGEWTVSIGVLINDFERIPFRAQIPVR